MSLLTKLRGQVERAEVAYRRLQDEPADRKTIDKAAERFRRLERELAAEEARLVAGGKLRF